MGSVIVTASRLGRDRASDDVFPFKSAMHGRTVNTNDDEYFVPRRDTWCRARVSAADTLASSTLPRCVTLDNGADGKGDGIGP
jgi:hypothetical protein